MMVDSARTQTTASRRAPLPAQRLGSGRLATLGLTDPDQIRTTVTAPGRVSIPARWRTSASSRPQSARNQYRPAACNQPEPRPGGCPPRPRPPWAPVSQVVVQVLPAARELPTGPAKAVTVHATVPHQQSRYPVVTYPCRLPPAGSASVSSAQPWQCATGSCPGPDVTTPHTRRVPVEHGASQLST